jgi:co-chaperonin GroES (HSP10)
MKTNDDFVVETRFAEFSENELPTVMLWRIAVTPMLAQTKTMGGIVLPEEAISSITATTYVCKVIALGALAYKGQLSSGVKMVDDPNLAKVGDFVVIGARAGQRCDFRDGRRIIFLNDDEILSKVKNPEDYKAYI